MVNVEQLKRVYADKLIATGSHEAFTKAVWVAYKQGLADADLQTLKGIRMNKTRVVILLASAALMVTFFWALFLPVKAQAAAAVWTQQPGVLNKYKVGSQEKHLPTNVKPSDIPSNYVKQPDLYFQCISEKNAKKYVSTDLDCYGKKLKADLVYCPLEFCITKDGGMAILTNSATYGDCDRLYFTKEKLVSVFDSSVESVNDCK
jgi:hypothetical protein